MDLHLDLATVLLVYNTSLVAGALSISHIRRHSCSPRGLAPLAAAYLTLAAGAALAWHGEWAALPMWMWTYGSLNLGTFAYAIFWAAIRGFSGRRIVRWKLVLLPPFACLVIGVVTEFPLQNLVRAGVFHATAALVVGLCAFEIVRDQNVEPLPSRPMMAIFLGLSGSIYALRLIYILSGTASSSGFAWAFYVQIFCNFGIALTVASMSNERAEIRLAEAAYTDPLTGVGNRRWLALHLPRRLPANSAIAQLDLDRFKRVNDDFGHSAGDQVLIEFTRCVQEQLRASDLVARMGGEEFVVYLPNVAKAEALAITERLRTRVEAMQVKVSGVRIPVTVSIGLVWVGATTSTAEEWLRLADEALYEAKRSTRNCVVLANDTLPEVSRSF